MNCLFCKIIAGEIPAQRVYENDHVIAFRDINPQAPVHVLLIPRRHIASLNELAPDDTAAMGHLLAAAPAIARQEGLADNGYRAVINTGAAAGQTVFHIHLHLLGGRPLGWPPG
ncbi:MAG: histidine triad nucleotide-binding protein [Blastocatellia bacterium]